MPEFFEYLSKSNKDIFLYGIFSITNIEDLIVKYNLTEFKFNSQYDFMLYFLQRFSLSKIDELKGSYSFVYFDGKDIYLIRDFIGLRPLFYYIDKNKLYFSFNHFSDGVKLNELNPNKYLKFEVINKNEINFNKKFEFKREINLLLKEYNYENFNMTKKKIKNLFINSILNLSLIKKDEENKYALLFSGGTDSTFMALILKEMGINFTCFTANIRGGNIKEGIDVYYAKKVAKELDLNLEIVNCDIERVEEYTKEIIKIIGDNNYTKISVALPLYIALKRISNLGFKNVFLGIGSEEIFADYKREEDISYEKINEICFEGLKSLWKRDLYRDFALTRYFNLNLILPFLEDDFLKYSLNINPKFKIYKGNKEFNKGSNWDLENYNSFNINKIDELTKLNNTNKTKNLTRLNKIILRDIIKDFGLSDELVYRKKVAAQYGCKSDRVFEKISKNKKILKQEYLDELVKNL